MQSCATGRTQLARPSYGAVMAMEQQAGPVEFPVPAGGWCNWHDGPSGTRADSSAGRVELRPTQASVRVRAVQGAARSEAWPLRPSDAGTSACRRRTNWRGSRYRAARVWPATLRWPWTGCTAARSLSGRTGMASTSTCGAAPTEPRNEVRAQIGPPAGRAAAPDGARDGGQMALAWTCSVKIHSPGPSPPADRPAGTRVSSCRWAGTQLKPLIWDARRAAAWSLLLTKPSATLVRPAS